MSLTWKEIRKETVSYRDSTSALDACVTMNSAVDRERKGRERGEIEGAPSAEIGSAHIARAGARQKQFHRGTSNYDVLTLRGEGLAQKQTIVLIGCLSVTVTRGRSPKYHNFCGCHKW